MNNLRRRVGAKAPLWLVRLYRRVTTILEFLCDCRDYNRSTLWRYGSGKPQAGQDPVECLESRLTLQYHGIEKGASFPDPKRPFGASKVVEIERLLNIADRLGIAPDGAEVARSSVSALKVYNETGAISDETTPRSDWDGHAYETAGIEKFVRTRHSVRNFDTTRGVDIALVRQIVKQASTTPSVCNRRSYRAHYFDDSTQIETVLSLQNGNRGFGYTIPGVIIVTVRRSSFTGSGERNQRWIDGGLFAMSIVWLCHAHGLGTCFLNWSQTNRMTNQLRTLARIPTSEDVITYIAVGYPASELRVARSLRRPEHDTFVYHGEESGGSACQRHR